MLDRLLVNHVWVAIGVWAILYCSDYALTLVCARLYRSGVDKHLAFKSLELTPYYQKDIAELRKFSPRFVLMLALSCGTILLIWGLQAGISQPFAWWSEFTQDVYRFVVGALLLMEMVVHLRHFRNLGLFRYARDSRGIEGRVAYSQWLSYRLSAIELVSFALVFVAFFLLTSNWFFIGGSAKCLVEGAKHWRLSARQEVAPQVSEPVVTLSPSNEQAVETGARNR